MRAPIAMQIQPFLFARETPDHALSGRTLIFISACVVDEVSLAKPTFSRGIAGQVFFGTITSMPACVYARQLSVDILDRLLLCDLIVPYLIVP